MKVSTLLGGFEIPFDLALLVRGHLPVQVGDDDVVGGEVDDAVVFDCDHVLGVPQERWNVRRQEVLAFSPPDHQRRPSPGGNDPVGFISPDNGDRQRTLGQLHHVAHRIRQRHLRAILDQVGEHLGVGLRRELVTGGDELLAQWRPVLDDAVVDHRNRVAAATMGVSVGRGRCTVSRPTRVADSDRTDDRL